MSEKRRCVLNVKDKMKEYAYFTRSRQKNYLNISADAVREMIGFLDAEMDVRMNLAVENALREKRKTVMTDDVIMSFGIVKPEARKDE